MSGTGICVEITLVCSSSHYMAPDGWTLQEELYLLGNFEGSLLVGERVDFQATTSPCWHRIRLVGTAGVVLMIKSLAIWTEGRHSGLCLHASVSRIALWHESVVPLPVFVSRHAREVNCVLLTLDLRTWNRHHRCPFWLIWSKNRLGDSWFAWGFNQLPGKPIYFPKKDTYDTHLFTSP